MSDDTRLKEIDLENPAYLIVAGSNPTPEVAKLATGSSVFVGSGSNCKIELVDDQVQQIHCMVWLEGDNVLKVQDWNTGTTFLNDSPVTDEMEMKSGDVLTVGSHRLTAVLDREFHFGIAVELLNGGADLGANPESDPTSQEQVQEQAEVEAEAEIDEAQQNLESTVQESVATVPVSASVGFSSDLPAEVNCNETGQSSGFTYDIDADLDDSENENHTNFNFSSVPQDLGFAFSDASEGLEDDELSLMRMELEQLRFELADRESQIQSLKQSQASSNSSDSLNEQETLKLVTRLEDLLDELSSSDQRVNGLEELLRVSDQATAAEKEERLQLEKWVTEIEQRVGQREEESQAEIGRLSRRLQDTTKELEQSANQIQSLATNGGNNTDEQQAAVTALAEQVESLREKLRESREENQELYKRPAVAADEVDLADKLKVTEDELVRLKVEMSRERAETARRHAELEGIRDELEERLRNVKSADHGDSRIQTMREHLREIHAKEEAEKADKLTNGLGGRIANLLTRLR
jgi:hypothetical protein